MKSYHLPMPPSTNALTRNTTARERERAAARGRVCPPRVKTDRYRAWIEEAGRLLLTQGPRVPIPDWFDLIIMLHAPRPTGRLDTDNIKAVADLLQRHGIITDDRLMASLKVHWVPLSRPWVTVTVVAAEDPWAVSASVGEVQDAQEA